MTLPEPNPRWLVLLGPRSMDQRRGLLCPITTVEPQYAGPPRPYPRAPRLRPRAFSIDGVDSFDGGFVCQHQLRKQTLLRLSINDCYADKPDLDKLTLKVCFWKGRFCSTPPTQREPVFCNTLAKPRHLQISAEAYVPNRRNRRLILIQINLALDAVTALDRSWRRSIEYR